MTGTGLASPQTGFCLSVVAVGMTDEDPISTARERARRRAEFVERIVSSVEDDIDADQYPIRSEELVTAYADQPLELDEEASLGGVFDRMETTEYRSATDLRSALTDEFAEPPAGGPGDEYEELERQADGDVRRDR